jgi:Fe-S-cluster-containing dehydrogenase component
VRTEFGGVFIQPDICNGCGYCANAVLLRIPSSRRVELSEHPTLPGVLAAFARAPFALLADRFLARETMASHSTRALCAFPDSVSGSALTNCASYGRKES